MKVLSFTCGFVLAASAVASAAGSGSGRWRPRAKPQKAFDHAVFDALLRAHVRPDGKVDYEGLSKKRRQLNRYARQLAGAKLNALSRGERMALWINAYNAFTLQAVLVRYPRLKSIRDLPDVWKRRSYNVAGKLYSLGEIENEVLRKRFGDARIHFAINCASAGCPVLRREAYTGARLEAQLDNAVRGFINSPRGMRLRTETGPSGKQVLVVELSPIFQWYRDDFVKGGGDLIHYVRRYAGAKNKKRLDPFARSNRVTFFTYDWSLNQAPKAATPAGKGGGSGRGR